MLKTVVDSLFHMLHCNLSMLLKEQQQNKTKSKNLLKFTQVTYGVPYSMVTVHLPPWSIMHFFCNSPRQGTHHYCQDIEPRYILNFIINTHTNKISSSSSDIFAQFNIFKTSFFDILILPILISLVMLPVQEGFFPSIIDSPISCLLYWDHLPIPFASIPVTRFSTDRNINVGLPLFLCLLVTLTNSCPPAILSRWLWPR